MYYQCSYILVNFIIIFLVTVWRISPSSWTENPSCTHGKTQSKCHGNCQVLGSSSQGNYNKCLAWIKRMYKAITYDNQCGGIIENLPLSTQIWPQVSVRSYPNLLISPSFRPILAKARLNFGEILAKSCLDIGSMLARSWLNLGEILTKSWRDVG